MVLGFVWAFGVTFVIFAIAKRFMQIRVSPEAEIEGLDVPEFGALCYPDFVLATERDGRPDDEPGQRPDARAGADAAREVTVMKLVTAIVKPFKLDDVKEAVLQARRAPG